MRAGWVPFGTKAEDLAGSVAKRGLRDVDDRLAKEIKRSVGIDVRAAFAVGGKIQHTMEASTKANVALIRSMPEQYFEKLETLISSGWADGMRWESMAKEIDNLSDETETRAKVIARDQTAKINSELNRTRQQSVGIEKYEWSTSQDERVRDSHAELDGKTFRWDDPPTVDGEQVNPGMAILCRCVAIPVVNLDQIEESAEALEEAA
jgi:SPP1 gp7 family putative phage head morphogenesis protein